MAALVHPLPEGGSSLAEHGGTAAEAVFPEAHIKSPGRPGPPVAPPRPPAPSALTSAAGVPVAVVESPDLPPEERDYRTWCAPRCVIGVFDCAGGWWCWWGLYGPRPPDGGCPRPAPREGGGGGPPDVTESEML